MHKAPRRPTIVRTRVVWAQDVYMEPNLFSILLGKHSYAVSPEEETSLARLYLLLGALTGLMVGLALR